MIVLTMTNSGQTSGATLLSVKRPSRGKPSYNTPAFTGNSAMENWMLQSMKDDPWNAIGMVSSAASPSQTFPEDGGSDGWSTTPAAGSAGSTKGSQ